MNFLKFTIISILLLISTFYISLNESQTPPVVSTFKFTGVCGGHENGQQACVFNDPNNWENDLVPVDGATIVIGPNVNGNQVVNIKGTSIKNSFAGITITGTTQSPIVIELDNTAIVFNGDFTASQSVTINLNNTDTNGNENGFSYDIDVSGTLSLSKSTSINGVFTFFQCDGANVDASSTFSFITNSNVNINGVASFYSQPKITDNSVFIASDTQDGGSTFFSGINNDYMVTLGVTTLMGASNFESLKLNAVITLGTNATAYISDLIKFTGAGSFTVSKGATLSIGGFYKATPPTITLVNGGILAVNNPYTNITSATLLGTGTVLFDTLAQADNSAINYISYIGNPDINIGVAGQANLFINNCTVGSLFDQQSNVNPKSYTPIVSISGINNFDFISTTLSVITLLDDSSTNLLGPTDSAVSGPIFTLGSLNIATKLLGTIITMDSLAYVQLNDSFIFGSLDLTGGRLHPSGSSGIGKDLIISKNGLLDFDEYSGNLDVNGNFQMDNTASIYVAQTLIPSTTAFMTVDGNIILNGTLVMDITNTQPTDGDSYRLIQCKGTITGQFSTISPIINGDLTGLQYTVAVDNNIISINFNTSKSPHKKLPGWGVFLIILAVLVVIGGGFYGFIRYKKRNGYLPLN